MARKKKVERVGKKTSDYSIGDKLLEGEYSAGRIVCIVDCPNSSMRCYLLLLDEKKRYTIYTAEKGVVCEPTLSRMIPEKVIQRMFLQAFYGVDITDEVLSDLSERSPVM